MQSYLIHLQFPVLNWYSIRLYLVLISELLWFSWIKTIHQQYLIFSFFFLECSKHFLDLRTIAGLLSPWTATTLKLGYSNFPGTCGFTLLFIELYLFVLQMPLIPVCTGILMKVVINANTCTVGFGFGFFLNYQRTLTFYHV